MRIAILDCVTSISPSLEKYGTVGGMIEAWLAPHLPDCELIRLAVGEGDRAPGADDFDGFIVSGSELGVYDTPTWMAPMRALLLAIRDAGKPVYGICFGHQLMADTYGGKAEKAAKWAAGVREFKVDGETFNAHVLHGDQVTRLPPRSVIAGSAGYCPIAVLRYEFPAMSTQFHPEYPAEFVEDVIDLIHDDLLGTQEGPKARQSMTKAEVKPALFAAQVADFFRRHAPRT